MTTCHTCRFLSETLVRAKGGLVEASCLNEHAPHNGTYRTGDDACPAHEGELVKGASGPEPDSIFMCEICRQVRPLIAAIAMADGRPLCRECYDRAVIAADRCTHQFARRPPYGEICRHCGLVAPSSSSAKN